MDSWFTVEQIDCNTFAISEYKHWEETHSYLLCGEKMAVLIDFLIVIHLYTILLFPVCTGFFFNSTASDLHGFLFFRTHFPFYAHISLYPILSRNATKPPLHFSYEKVAKHWQNTWTSTPFHIDIPSQNAI